MSDPGLTYCKQKLLAEAARRFAATKIDSVTEHARLAKVTRLPELPPTSNDYLEQREQLQTMIDSLPETLAELNEAVANLAIDLYKKRKQGSQ